MSLVSSACLCNKLAVCTALSKTCRDSITRSDARTAAHYSVLRFIYVSVLFINSNSNISRHVLLSFVEIELPRLPIVLKTVSVGQIDDCLLSWLQQRGIVALAWLLCGNCFLDYGFT